MDTNIQAAELAEAIAWLKSEEVMAGERTLQSIRTVLAALSQAAPAAQKIVDAALKWYGTGWGKDEAAHELAMAVMRFNSGAAAQAVAAPAATPGWPASWRSSSFNSQHLFQVARELDTTREKLLGAPAAATRTYGEQYTPAQREWCQRYERETTFEPLMEDFEAGNESFLDAAKNSRNWFESWSSDAYLRGCDNIPGEMEALHEEITGEKP